MDYLQAKFERLIPDLQQYLLDTAAENQAQTEEHVKNTVNLAISAAMGHVTFIAIDTTVLQDSLHSDKLLTHLSALLMVNTSKMLPIAHFIESTARAILTSLNTKDHAKKAQHAALSSFAYDAHFKTTYQCPEHQWVLFLFVDQFKMKYSRRS